MEIKNNLEEVIKQTYKTNRLVYPNAEVLSRLKLSRRQFYRLCKGQTRLLVSEAIVIAEWLNIPVTDLISHAYEINNTSANNFATAPKQTA